MRELSSAVELTSDDRDYIEAALAGVLARTREQYAKDLVRFALFFDPESCGRLRTLDRFLLLDAPAAHAITWNYREVLMRDGLGPATINRRLSALRAFCARAAQVGRVVWTLRVPNLSEPPARIYHVTPADIAAVIAHLSTGAPDYEPRRARDACAIRLTWDLALRRSEILAVDVGDYDARGGVLFVKRKGKTGKKAMLLPQASIHALDRWIDARAAGAGADQTAALFVQYETLPKVERISDRGYYDMVCRRTLAILGKELPPHAIRHASITYALETTNGNVARVADGFADHADPRTTMRYDDMRKNDGAVIAQLVSESVPGPGAPLLASSAAAASRASRAFASVGRNLSRNSAERSAILARSSFDGPAITMRPPADLCSACGSEDPGPGNWEHRGSLTFCSFCCAPAATR